MRNHNYTVVRSQIIYRTQLYISFFLKSDYTLRNYHQLQNGPDLMKHRFDEKEGQTSQTDEINQETHMEELNTIEKVGEEWKLFYDITRN